TSSGVLASDITIELEVPCGSGTLPVDVVLSFSSTGVSEAPPSVDITINEQVLCPATVTLTANASDSDDDLDGVRSVIDGVLMAPGTSQVKFWNPPTTFRAIARDERGAVTVDEQVVSCLPV